MATTTVTRGLLPASVNDLAGLSLAQGDVLYFDGTNLANLGPGTAGEVLTTQGPGADPAWAAPAGTPTGAVLSYGGASAPSGWLLCDGSAVSRTTYADLFTALGTAFGVGDGSTTFNLPDLRGRAPIGTGQGSGLTNRVLADQVGAETHVLTMNEMPSHSHTIPQITPSGSSSYGFAYYGNGESTSYYSTSSTGGNIAHNNIPPSLALNFIIKT